MRYTEYHCGVPVVKDKSLLFDALAKLAKYEDVEEEPDMDEVLRDHMAVMDDGTQGRYLLPCRGCLLHQLHCPADTKAEASAFCQGYAHGATFFAMMSFMAAMTPSISSSEVSSLTESRLIFRGATSRWVSW